MIVNTHTERERERQRENGTERKRERVCGWNILNVCVIKRKKRKSIIEISLSIVCVKS